MRLDLVDDTTAGSLREALTPTAEGHHDGVILDVRYGCGGTTENGRDLRKVLARVPVPKAVLIGPRTQGAAEVVAAASARGELMVVTVGGKTAGFPVSWGLHSLSTEQTILLPNVPQKSSGSWQLSPVSPVVPVDQHLSQAEIQGALMGLRVRGAPPVDRVLSRAVDLLAAIVALK